MPDAEMDKMVDDVLSATTDVMPAEPDVASNKTETETAPATRDAAPAATTPPVEKPAASPSVDPGWLNQDDKGNLVDREGNVVFKAGMGRRVYEQFRRMQKEHGDATKELQDLRAFREAAGAVNEVVAKTGLDPDSIQAGLELTAAFQKDPINTIQQLIGLAQSRGLDTSAIGAASPVSPDVIARIIDAKLQPILQERQAAAREAEVMSSARQEAEAFLSDPVYPYARIHADLIAHLVREENIDPREAYVKLMHAATARGLNFSRPLGEQIASASPAASPPRPAPTRSASPVLQTAIPVGADDQDGQFDVNSSWLDNLRRTYRSLT